MKFIHILIFTGLLIACNRNQTKVTKFGPVNEVENKVVQEFPFLNLPKKAKSIYFYDETTKNDIGPNPFTTYLRFSCNIEDTEKWLNDNFEVLNKKRFENPKDLGEAYMSKKWFDFLNSKSGYYWEIKKEYHLVAFDEKREILYFF